jgi:hypothetical protein
MWNQHQRDLPGQTRLAGHWRRLLRRGYSTRDTRCPHHLGGNLIERDVTRLSRLQISKPVDLVLDMGCYHCPPDQAKPKYVAPAEQHICLLPVRFGTPSVRLENRPRRRGEMRRSCSTKRPINQHPLSVSPLNDANLMTGLHAGDRVDTKPTEQGGGIESL